MRMRGGTKRDESRRSEGARAARVAAMLGTPLLPWQRYVLDVATEIDPDTGSYYYNRVVISTPKPAYDSSGKLMPAPAPDSIITRSPEAPISPHASGVSRKRVSPLSS